MIDLFTAIFAGAVTAIMLLAGAFAAGSSRTEKKILERKLKALDEAKKVKDDVEISDDINLADRAAKWVRKPGD
jgi:hypothetical protein